MKGVIKDSMNNYYLIEDAVTQRRNLFYKASMINSTNPNHIEYLKKSSISLSHEVVEDKFYYNELKKLGLNNFINTYPNLFNSIR